MNKLAVIFGWIFINAWYMECLVQIVMAANRFCIITLKQYHIFTFKFTMWLFVILISITTFSAVCTQYLFPCCVFISDHTIMSFMFVNPDNSYSYSNLMLVSYDIFCTSTSTLCYISVFFSIRNSYKEVSHVRSNQNNKANKDIKYLLQFVFISVFYIFTWVLFEILPHIVPAGQVEWFSVVPVLVTLNCSSNSVIYLCVNREVQKSIQFAWSRSKVSISKVSTNATNAQSSAAVDN
ncbi:hypothetical protein GCK72_019847 [Caenorhabditis remanei]|uniref:7TM GPCR serpentine receptor class x (Srx) domain-containing protein n=1 Tax=Caenorhabditis remanei TaxID=31234 RepID=A0A6A5GFD5_CAERE|nr:hypothetical protein GCK72_019847 [Caenorhabditis remanei]KAF1753291.1 hypothetical protein GCK72_019847 [Caenorhabditis remanei]